MQLSPPKTWKHEFARSTDVDRYREILRRVHDEARKKEKEEKAEAAEESSLGLMAIATEIELAAFDVKINHYETASYEALLENERVMDLVRAERQEMLSNAFELPDGRKVFESEDGRRVFSADGEELDPAIVTAEEIEDWRPKYETFQASNQRLDELLSERTEIIDYQVRLEEARERVEDGQISKGELQALGRTLADEMPDAVRDQLPEANRPVRGLEASQPEAIATLKPGGNLGMPTL